MLRSKLLSIIIQSRYVSNFCQPKHLICFKDWTPAMVMDIIISALNLKSKYRNTHGRKLDTLQNAKVMILQETNEPILNMAICKAASFLGAFHVTITDQMVWHHDYNGSIFSSMTDAIFVSTSTHMCVQRFAERAMVPVMCMKSRTHATIQSLATVMAIMEELGTMKCVNIAWVGPPHPVLNSYLLLCPMLGANIRFKCCCNKSPVHPLLLKIATEFVAKSKTEMKECRNSEEALQNACVVISGPEVTNKEKLSEFELCAEIIDRNSENSWLFFHTCPRGAEVNDELFYHAQSRTFVAFENMQYIAAALMANAICDCNFRLQKPRHLICFKQWTAEMVMSIICSAINLKTIYSDTHCTRLDTLKNADVMILQEVNEPILNMAVCKAATFLGADHSIVTDHLVWNHAYNGRIFSTMVDAIFVSTSTQMCIQRFADTATVPVICMKSRTHGSIQALATIMAIVEELGTMHDVNVSWVGPPHPVLNSYLLLCPMLGANIRFKCCGSKNPVHPLLMKVAENMQKISHTKVLECPMKHDALFQANVVISGPEDTHNEKNPDFQITANEIAINTTRAWLYFHTCPRGNEVTDDIFYHKYARTFMAFDNMQYIAAALMVNGILGLYFDDKPCECR